MISAEKYGCKNQPFCHFTDVSLPAVFMPTKNTNMMVFNPRANKYFHPTGKMFACNQSIHYNFRFYGFAIK